MDSIIRARAYVLGDDVDTDQIIPAKHLAISLGDPIERRRYGGLALSGVPKGHAGLPNGGVKFADAASNKTAFAVVIAGRNFGCGSSREHAPVALAEAGVKAVVARSYARIFFRNAVDGGYFPPIESDEPLSSLIKTNDEVVVDIRSSTLHHVASGQTRSLKDLGAAGEIIGAGGLFAYARNLNLMD